MSGFGETMIVDCVSDLHGHYPELDGGDILIIGGDLTARDYSDEYEIFFDWLENQEYKKIVFIAGNHDNYLQSHSLFKNLKSNITYLCDSLCTFEGLTIYGTPWTPLFEGVNPHCKAFMCNESKLAAKFALIPDKVDILVSHGPPKGCLDGVQNWDSGKIEHVGSSALLDAVGRSQPLYHVFGHIHEHGGKRMAYKWMMDDRPDCQMYNTSYVNERYLPVNKVVRINIPNREYKPLNIKDS